MSLYRLATLLTGNPNNGEIDDLSEADAAIAGLGRRDRLKPEIKSVGESPHFVTWVPVP